MSIAEALVCSGSRVSIVLFVAIDSSESSEMVDNSSSLEPGFPGFRLLCFRLLSL